MFIKFLILMSLANAAFAQNCKTLRECQIKNTQLQTQINFLKTENYSIFSQLNECQMANIPLANNGRQDLIFSLQNKKFKGYIETDSCMGNCAIADLRFIFINDTLKLQIETTGRINLNKKVVDLVIPDKYGEFLTIPHPLDVMDSPRSQSQCRYIIERNEAKAITKLNLLDYERRGSSRCPEEFFLSTK